MKKPLGFLLGGAVLALLSVTTLKVAAASGARRDSSSKPAEEGADDNATALTIYNQNFFVAREHVPLDLQAGVNEAHYTGVPAHLEPDSVMLCDPNGHELQILEQNYRNDPVTQQLLLSLYEGKTIDFQQTDKDGNPRAVQGKIIRSGYVPHHGAYSTYGQPYYQAQAAFTCRAAPTSPSRCAWPTAVFAAWPACLPGVG
ncbi:MAG TPA: hypothetical protein VKE24_10730 [Candidatus Acidoferrales bacterium]|nr:hypothetical protein [Candidatus Acidoferrales bacterium]